LIAVESPVLPTRWYVVRTKPRHEQIALRNLLNQGYEAWLPMHTARRHRAGRWQIVRGPLFPCYAFARLGHVGQGIAPIRSTLGVVGLVRFGEQPATMPQSVVDDLHALEVCLAESADHPVVPFQPGAAVRIVSGPFAGLEGIVSRTAKERVGVLLELLGREQNVDFDSRALDKLC
jgi:transcriptional antiterminator RfaH